MPVNARYRPFGEGHSAITLTSSCGCVTLLPLRRTVMCVALREFGLCTGARSRPNVKMSPEVVATATSRTPTVTGSSLQNFLP